jgi:hypothetical protein
VIAGALLGRRVVLEFGTEGAAGKRFTDLRVGFRVDMSRSADPNKGRIVAYNLAAESVSLLQRPRAVVRLLVGYDVPRLIFVGTPIANGVRLERNGPDRVIVIEALDGGRAWQAARVDLSYAPQTSFAQVFADVVAAIGLPTGTVHAPAGLRFSSGLVLAGAARDVLSRLAVMADRHWFVRDGVLHFVEIGGDTGETAPLISSRTGNLIGSPMPRAATKANEAAIEVRALLDPAIRPGRRFQLESEAFNGVYIARDVVFEGDSGYEAPFYVTITAQRAT